MNRRPQSVCTPAVFTAFWNAMVNSIASRPMGNDNGKSKKGISLRTLLLYIVIDVET